LVKNPLVEASESSGHKMKQASPTTFWLARFVLCQLQVLTLQKSIFAAATNSTNNTKQGRQCAPLISQLFNMMSMPM
jgi:hypothetical protein